MKIAKSINQKGSTIVEMTIYVAFLMVLVVVLSTLLLSVLESKLEFDNNSFLQSDARFIISRISYDIYRSSSISSPASINQTSTTLTLSAGGSTLSYYLSGNYLILDDGTIPPPSGGPGGSVSIGDGSTQPQYLPYALNSFHTKVSNLSFKKLGNTGGKDTIEINFTLESGVVGSRTYEKQDFYDVIGGRL